MSTKTCLIVSLASVLLLASTPVLSAEENPTYIIGPGDVLEISVWRHPELNRTVTVRPDSRISFSLIGDVNAAGTPAQLDKAITGQLFKYITDPKVTVIITDFGSKRVVVMGEVSRPGSYPIGERITVLEAIANAGSYTERAALRSVTITRKSETGTPEVIKVNLSKVIKKGAASKDIVLEPGDVVCLPKRHMAAWEAFDRYFIRGILPIMGFIIMIDELDDD